MGLTAKAGATHRSIVQQMVVKVCMAHGETIVRTINTREFQIPPAVARCTVSWKQWCSGSRDSEQDRVYINDQVVWTRDTRSDGHPGSLSERWQNGPNEGFDQDAWFGEEAVEVDCSGTLSVHFHSDIDESRGNEKWAFSDVKIMPN